MMAELILSNLRGRKFAVSLDGDSLLVSPSYKLADDDRDYIRAYKTEIVDMLRAEAKFASLQAMLLLPEPFDPWGKDGDHRNLVDSSEFGEINEALKCWLTFNASIDKSEAEKQERRDEKRATEAKARAKKEAKAVVVPTTAEESR